LKAGIFVPPGKERILGRQLESSVEVVEYRMRTSPWTPSLVPSWADQTVYIVENDFGRAGRAFVASLMNCGADAICDFVMSPLPFKILLSIMRGIGS
jgi:hypothetical protein